MAAAELAMKGEPIVRQKSGKPLGQDIIGLRLPALPPVARILRICIFRLLFRFSFCRSEFSAENANTFPFPFTVLVEADFLRKMKIPVRVHPPYL